MTDLKPQLLRLAEFVDSSREIDQRELKGFWKTQSRQLIHAAYTGSRLENARLKPLIEALIEDREALREALKSYANEEAAIFKREYGGKPYVNHMRATVVLAASDARLLKLGEGKNG